MDEVVGTLIRRLVENLAVSSVAEPNDNNLARIVLRKTALALHSSAKCRVVLPSQANRNEYERRPQTRKADESKSIGWAALRVGFGQNVRGADI